MSALAVSLANGRKKVQIQFILLKTGANLDSKLDEIEKRGWYVNYKHFGRGYQFIASKGKKKFDVFSEKSRIEAAEELLRLVLQIEVK